MGSRFRGGLLAMAAIGVLAMQPRACAENASGMADVRECLSYLAGKKWNCGGSAWAPSPPLAGCGMGVSVHVPGDPRDVRCVDEVVEWLKNSNKEALDELAGRPREALVACLTVHAKRNEGHGIHVDGKVLGALVPAALDGEMLGIVRRSGLAFDDEDDGLDRLLCRRVMEGLIELPPEERDIELLFRIWWASDFMDQRDLLLLDELVSDAATNGELLARIGSTRRVFGDDKDALDRLISRAMIEGLVQLPPEERDMQLLHRIGWRMESVMEPQDLLMLGELASNAVADEDELLALSTLSQFSWRMPEETLKIVRGINPRGEDTCFLHSMIMSNLAARVAVQNAQADDVEGAGGKKVIDVDGCLSYLAEGAWPIELDGLPWCCPEDPREVQCAPAIAAWLENAGDEELEQLAAKPREALVACLVACRRRTPAAEDGGGAIRRVPVERLVPAVFDREALSIVAQSGQRFEDAKDPLDLLLSRRLIEGLQRQYLAERATELLDRISRQMARGLERKDLEALGEMAATAATDDDQYAALVAMDNLGWAMPEATLEILAGIKARSESTEVIRVSMIEGLSRRVSANEGRGGGH